MSHENQIVNKGDQRSRAESVVPLPSPRVPITIRPATLADLPFIDGLQKAHTKMVGWMPTQQLDGKIKLGHVLIAEERHEGTEARRHGGVMEGEGRSADSALDPSLPGPHFVPACLRASVPVGYLIGHDQYFKRDDVGIIYQLNIAPNHRRSLVGAAMIKAMFERAAYGCKLFCCWCAQDIEANYFWESLGFIPLAFRAGSREKGRVHIFWQKRIRAGDETTPYWFPAQTNSGSIREDRLVLPIPPGTHWRDVMPVILPGEESTKSQAPNLKHISSSKSKIQNNGPLPPTRRGARFGRPSANPLPPVAVKRQKPKKHKVKNDPRLVAAARELRDRWLEKVNEDPAVLQSNGKYELSRLPETSPHQTSPHRPASPPPPLLEAA